MEDRIATMLEGALEELKSKPQTRKTSLTTTKIQEALMWWQWGDQANFTGTAQKTGVGQQAGTNGGVTA